MSAGDRDPFAYARAGDDTALIEAERRLQAIMAQWEDPSRGNTDDEADALSHAEYEEIEFINNTAPTTLAGAAIKLRVLADPAHGMEAGDRDDDYLSLRQILAFIEQAAAST
jgi:hypothetical protein